MHDMCDLSECARSVQYSTTKPILCDCHYLSRFVSVWVEILHTRIAAAGPDSIVRHHFECYFSRSRAGVRILIAM